MTVLILVESCTFKLDGCIEDEGQFETSMRQKFTRDIFLIFACIWSTIIPLNSVNFYTS